MCSTFTEEKETKSEEKRALFLPSLLPLSGAKIEIFRIKLRAIECLFLNLIVLERN